MRTIWLRLGCFMIGYNYPLLRTCSEHSQRRVLKYASAIVIPCIIWAFVGYIFATRYLKLDWYYGLLAMILMIITVIQIERQIILSDSKSKAPMVFRLVVGINMALIGSIIVDQIIFREDIEKKKIVMMDEEVKQVFPGRAEELRRQIKEIDSTLIAKEHERSSIIDDVAKNPMLVIYTYEKKTEQKDTIKSETTTRTAHQVENPKKALLQPLDQQLAGLRSQKMSKDSMLLSLRPTIEADLKQHVGFLDELQVMISILVGSTSAMIAWMLFIIFLLCIEAFILVSKFSETETDYDELILHQMKIHVRKIELLHLSNH